MQNADNMMANLGFGENGLKEDERLLYGRMLKEMQKYVQRSHQIIDDYKTSFSTHLDRSRVLTQEFQMLGSTLNTEDSKTSLESQIKGLAEQLDSYTSQNGQLLARYAEEKSNFQSLNDNICELLRGIGEGTEFTQEDYANQDELLHKLNCICESGTKVTRGESFANERTEFLSEIGQGNIDIDKLKNEIIKLKAEVGERDTKIEKLTSENISLRLKNNELEKKVLMFGPSCGDAQEEIEELNRIIYETNEENEKLKDDLKAIREENDKLHSLIKHPDNAEQSIREFLREKVSTLDCQIKDGIESGLSEAQRTIEELTVENAKRISVSSGLEDEIRKLKLLIQEGSVRRQEGVGDSSEQVPYMNAGASSYCGLSNESIKNHSTEVISGDREDNVRMGSSVADCENCGEVGTSAFLLDERIRELKGVNEELTTNEGPKNTSKFVYANVPMETIPSESRVKELEDDKDMRIRELENEIRQFNAEDAIFREEIQKLSSLIDEKDGKNAEILRKLEELRDDYKTQEAVLDLMLDEMVKMQNEIDKSKKVESDMDSKAFDSDIEESMGRGGGAHSSEMSFELQEDSSFLKEQIDQLMNDNESQKLQINNKDDRIMDLYVENEILRSEIEDLKRKVQFTPEIKRGNSGRVELSLSDARNLQSCDADGADHGEWQGSTDTINSTMTVQSGEIQSFRDSTKCDNANSSQFMEENSDYHKEIFENTEMKTYEFGSGMSCSLSSPERSCASPQEVREAAFDQGDEFLSPKRQLPTNLEGSNGKSAQDRIEELEQVISNMEKSYSERKKYNERVIRKASERIKKFAEEIRSLKSENIEIRQTNKRLQEKISELRSSESPSSLNDESLKHLQDELELKSLRIDEFEKESARDKEKIAHLKGKIDKFNTFKSLVSQSLSKQKERLKQRDSEVHELRNALTVAKERIESYKRIMDSDDGKRELHSQYDSLHSTFVQMRTKNQEYEREIDALNEKVGNLERMLSGKEASRAGAYEDSSENTPNNTFVERLAQDKMCLEAKVRELEGSLEGCNAEDET